MKHLAILLRLSFLDAHNVHHALFGPNFLSDHPFAGEAYDQLQDAYDDVVETAIGNGQIQVSELAEIQKSAAGVVANLDKKSPEELLQVIADNDDAILKEIEHLCSQSDTDQGDTNLLGDLAQKCKKRSKYLLARRLQ